MLLVPQPTLLRRLILSLVMVQALVARLVGLCWVGCASSGWLVVLAAAGARAYVVLLLVLVRLWTLSCT